MGFLRFRSSMRSDAVESAPYGVHTNAFAKVILRGRIKCSILIWRGLM